MRRLAILVGAVLVNASLAAGLDEARQAELDHLLAHDCGSCHGLQLRGGLGPALTPAHMRQRAAEYLRDAIREGIPGTAMPPWGPLLTEEDIDYLARTLRDGQP